MTKFHSIGGHEIEAHYAGGQLLQDIADISDGITGGGPTDTAAWLQRTCPGTDGPATIDGIHGRTVVWNQMVSNGNFADNSNWTVVSVHFSWSVVSNTAVITATDGGYTVGLASEILPLVDGHKYLSSVYARGSESMRLYVSLNSNSATINGTSANVQLSNTFEKVSGIVTFSTPSSGTNRIRIASAAASTESGDVLTLANVQLFDLTAMFGAGNEPSTVAEFEALYPEPYYPYDAGSLLSVQMEGIETVGFNQWDEEWVNGYFGDTGTWGASNNVIASKNPIPVLPNTTYYFKVSAPIYITCWENAQPSGVSSANPPIGSQRYEPTNHLFTTPANCHYIHFNCGSAYGNTYKGDICINLSWSGYRNGEYEPYWKSERTIPAATYFPQDMCSVGTVYDELTSDAAVTRVGVVDLGTLEWSRAKISDAAGYRYTTPTSDIKTPETNNGKAQMLCAHYNVVSTNQTGSAVEGIGLSTAGNLSVYDAAKSTMTAAEFKTAMSGVMLVYVLATPTTQTIDPPLNLTYRVSDFGTERIMHTNPTAAPTLVITYGSTADGIRDRALAAIAPVENGKASANYGVGSYLIHNGTFCRVTTAIATGEAIAIGTNVTATTVMAELLTLTQ